MRGMKDLSKKINFWEIFFFAILFIFSSFLMWKTFRVNSSGNMQVATRVWSDFAATIPLIRSFSYGSNFPIKYPIFAGPPIRYHFVFFAVVGFLEKIGLRIDWALNGLSVLGFFLLCFVIYLVGKTVFKSRSVGILSVILFLFNGSFGFLEFFKRHPLSLNTFTDIIKNTEFSSFGPYDGKIVSAFWSLNIFTNQRHLSLAYASFIFLVLSIFYFSKHPKKFTWTLSLLLGIFLGLFPFIHLAVFAMMGIAIFTFFILYPKIRVKLIVLGLIAITLAVPQYFYMGKSANQTELFNPGYLIGNKTPFGILTYWIMNLGIGLLLAPVGFIFAKRSQRKVFLPFLILFLVGNLFRFSAEVAANHKFFNLFVIGMNFYVALTLVKIWRVKIFGKIAAILLLIPLTLTGIIDFFPIVNDRHIELLDYPNDPKVSFIVENTDPDSTFLNSQFLYHPASVAGRKIFMGWPYFPWSAGYDTHERGQKLDALYSSNNKVFVCNLLLQSNIDYVTVQDTSNDRDFPDINIDFFEQNFRLIYKDSESEFRIFDVSSSCR